jgi:hypothetical protein
MLKNMSPALSRVATPLGPGLDAARQQLVGSGAPRLGISSAGPPTATPPPWVGVATGGGQS